MARPRKFRARTKSGRLSRAGQLPARDTGTPELQAKRSALVGATADPALASSALGCLFARGHIGKAQHAAGLEFERVRRALYGPPWPNQAFGPEVSEDRLRDLRRRFIVMTGLLTKEQEHVVAAVCVFNEWPQWFFNGVLRLKDLPEDQRDRDLLLDGLDALAKGMPAVMRGRVGFDNRHGNELKADCSN